MNRSELHQPRIAHIITNLGDGGAQRVLYNLCRSTQGKNNFIISLSAKEKYSEILVGDGFSVFHLNMPRGRITLSGTRALYRILRSEKPDVVQTWMYHSDLFGGVIARLAGCHTVFWGLRHTDFTPDSTGWSTRFVAHLCALLSHSVPKRIVACAMRARDVHIALGYAAKKIVVIPNGYDLKHLAPDTAVRQKILGELGFSGPEKVIGLIGRWHPQKDHDTFLEAASLVRRRVPSLKVLLVGTGCSFENEDFLRLVHKYDLADTIHALGQRTDIPAIMNALDLHVLSSSHGEAFPNVVAEAMACGTPCVVTDTGDAAFIVGDTGWVVPPRDPQKLANAIDCALSEIENDTDWSARKRAARRRIVENFSIDSMVERYYEVWESESVRESV